VCTKAKIAVATAWGIDEEWESEKTSWKRMPLGKLYKRMGKQRSLPSKEQKMIFF
jgi:hypothetical protein